MVGGGGLEVDRLDPRRLLVRAMTAADVTRVAALERSIFPDAWSRGAFLQEVEGGSHGFPVVLTDGPRILAYMVSWIIADETHLGNIAVAPEARRKGLAQRLLDVLIERSRERGSRLITLEVRRSNRAARALYEKYGFYPAMVRRAYYSNNGEDAVVMVKMLTRMGPVPPRVNVDDR